MAILEGKKAIIIGDRDGIPGPAIAECVKTAGAESSILIYGMFRLNERRRNGSGKPEESKRIR